MKTTSNLTYAQQYYAKRKAAQMGITVAQYLNSQKGKRSSIKLTTKNNTPVKQEKISFDRVVKLDDINVNENMLRLYKSGQPIDTMFSYESGIPVGTNIMCTGDPGVGKTTVLLHTLANLQLKNRDLKCLFICGEMSKIQMHKYKLRFPIFGAIKTIFTSDFLNYNMKDVIEQLLKQGYDYVVVDSIAEVLDSVKEDAGMSQTQAEKWLVDLCVNNNEANNDAKCYTTFLLIQQVTKQGLFVGSNKLKHITDAHMEMRREKVSDGGGTYIAFSKNRNGQAGIKCQYQLTNTDIHYAMPEQDDSVEKGITEFELANGVKVYGI